MKFLLSLTIFAALATGAVADIQAPPMSREGPARKFGRGLSNVLFGFTELPCTMMQVNSQEGNSAAAGYGFHLGLSRTCYRFGKGWYEILSAPFPTYRNSYRSPYYSDLIWGQNGFGEFPPELGFETRFDYSREYNGY